MCPIDHTSEREYIISFVKYGPYGGKNNNIIKELEEFAKGEKHGKGFERFLEYVPTIDKDIKKVKILASANIEEMKSIQIFTEYRESNKGCGIAGSFALVLVIAVVIFATHNGIFKPLTISLASCAVIFLLLSISLAIRENVRYGRSIKITLAGKSISRSKAHLELVSEIEFPQSAPVISDTAFREEESATCPVCLGIPEWTTLETCLYCGGQGSWKVPSDPKDYSNPRQEYVTHTCDTCNGTGKVTVHHQCYTCEAKGNIKLAKWVSRYNKQFAIPFNKRLENLRPLVLPNLNDLNQKIKDLNQKIDIWNRKFILKPN